MIDRLPDSRGWIGIGEFTLVLIVLGMMAGDKGLLKDDFFKTIATLIIGAFIKDIVGWAYSATKAGGELAANNAAIVSSQAGAPAPPPPEGTGQ